MNMAVASSDTSRGAETTAPTPWAKNERDKLNAPSPGTSNPLAVSHALITVKSTVKFEWSY